MSLEDTHPTVPKEMTFFGTSQGLHTIFSGSKMEYLDGMPSKLTLKPLLGTWWECY